MVKRKRESRGKNHRQDYINRYRGVFNHAVAGSYPSERRSAANLFFHELGSSLSPMQVQLIRSHITSGSSVDVANMLWKKNDFENLLSQKYSEKYPEESETTQPAPKVAHQPQPTPQDYDAENERLKKKQEDSSRAMNIRSSAIRMIDRAQHLRRSITQVAPELKKINLRVIDRGEKAKKVSKAAGIVGKVGKLGSAILGVASPIVGAIFPPAASVTSAIATGLAVTSSLANAVSGAAGAVGEALSGGSGEAIANNVDKVFSGMNDVLKNTGHQGSPEQQDCQAIAEVQVQAFKVKDTRVPSNEERRDQGVQNSANLIQSTVPNGPNLDSVPTETIERGNQGLANIQASNILVNGATKVLGKFTENVHNVNVKDEAVNMNLLNSASEVFKLLSPWVDERISKAVQDVVGYASTLINSSNRDAATRMDTLRRHMVTVDQLQQNTDFFLRTIENLQANNKISEQKVSELLSQLPRRLEKTEDYMRRQKEINEQTDNVIKQIHDNQEAEIKNSRLLEESHRDMQETIRKIAPEIDGFRDLLQGKANVDTMNSMFLKNSQSIENLIPVVNTLNNELKTLKTRVDENTNMLQNKLANETITEKEQQQLDMITSIGAQVKNLQTQIPQLIGQCASLKQEYDEKFSVVHKENQDSYNYMNTCIKNFQTAALRTSGNRAVLLRSLEDNIFLRQYRHGVGEIAEEDAAQVARIFQMAENFSDLNALGSESSQALGDWLGSTERVLPYYVGRLNSNRLLQLASQLDHISGKFFGKVTNNYNEINSMIMAYEQGLPNTGAQREEEMEIDKDLSAEAKAFADAEQMIKLEEKDRARQQTRPQAQAQADPQAQSQKLRERQIPDMIKVSYDILNARPEKRQRVNAASAQGMHLVGGRPDPRLDFVDFWNKKIAAFRTGKRYPRKYY